MHNSPMAEPCPRYWLCTETRGFAVSFVQRILQAFLILVAQARMQNGSPESAEPSQNFAGCVASDENKYRRRAGRQRRAQVANECLVDPVTATQPADERAAGGTDA